MNPFTDFQEVLAELDDILKNASFLGIDGEFTGLNSGPDAGAFDTPAQYYAKLRAGSMDFLLIQFGLSVFTFNKETNKYVFISCLHLVCVKTKYFYYEIN